MVNLKLSVKYIISLLDYTDKPPLPKALMVLRFFHEPLLPPNVNKS